MSENTKIEWADHTFNPWIGCQKVGPGCDNCYAETLATARLGVAWGPHAERRRTAPSTWKLPRRWNSRAAKLGIRYRVFCASLADVFDNAAPAGARADLAMLIRETPHLDWLLLTKRIGNAPDMLAEMFAFDIPANVFVGATIVNQDEWNRDAGKIAQVAVLIGKRRVFLSMEPLLGPIDFGGLGRYRMQSIVGWIIAGGESGPGARPMNPQWARDIRDQCADAGIPFLFKQNGEWVSVGEVEGFQGNLIHEFDDGRCVRLIGKKRAGRTLDGRTHDGVPS